MDKPQVICVASSWYKMKHTAQFLQLMVPVGVMYLPPGPAPGWGTKVG